VSCVLSFYAYFDINSYVRSATEQINTLLRRVGVGGLWGFFGVSSSCLAVVSIKAWDGRTKNPWRMVAQRPNTSCRKALPNQPTPKPKYQPTNHPNSTQTHITTTTTQPIIPHYHTNLNHNQLPPSIIPQQIPTTPTKYAPINHYLETSPTNAQANTPNHTTLQNKPANQAQYTGPMYPQYLEPIWREGTEKGCRSFANACP